VGAVGFLIRKRKHTSQTGPIGFIMIGALISLISIIIMVTFFKSYAGVPLKKADYYEVTSYVKNMKIAMNSHSSQKENQAEDNIVYLAKASKFSASTIALTKTAKRSSNLQTKKTSYTKFSTDLVQKLTDNPDEQKILIHQIKSHAKLD